MKAPGPMVNARVGIVALGPMLTPSVPSVFSRQRPPVTVTVFGFWIVAFACAPAKEASRRTAAASRISLRRTGGIGSRLSFQSKNRFECPEGDLNPHRDEREAEFNWTPLTDIKFYRSLRRP